MSVKETVFEILGVEEKPQSQQQLVTVGLIRQGFPVETVGRVASRYGISSGQLAKMLGSSERTISRRKKEKKSLDATSSDRIYRLARIFALAEEVFSSPQVAQDWLKRPNRALAGAIPFELLDTDAGPQQVEEVLSRIEYGVYS